MPERDLTRWLPIGRDLTRSLNLSSYLIAWLTKLGRTFHPSLSLYTTALYYPIICYLLSLLLIWLTVKRWFGITAAQLTTLLLAVHPSMLGRSAAGFADRDALCLLLALGGGYSYLRARTSSSSKQGWIWMGISALSMSLLALSWEGVGIFTSIIALVELIRFIIRGYSRRDLLT
ncbi:TPA: hypothetical protein EYP37_03170 [Candidatus Poribacteria bacterium]|nr:hypothetical protein [Candidatus Poribacteria bacterium]